MSETQGYALPDDAVPPNRAASAPAPGAPLGNHYDGCFACGSDHPDGLHLTAVAGDGVDIISRVRVTGAHQGAPGLAHGGIIAAIMDETLGFLLWMLGTAGVTAKLELQYRKPVPIDSDVVGRGVATGVAGRKIFTYGALHLGDADGPVVAEASGLFVVVGEKHFAPYVRHVSGSAAELVRDTVAGRRPRYNP